MTEVTSFLVGIGIFALGAVGYRYAYPLSLIGEQLDAIGSTTPMAEVEPAGWKVFLTRAIGVLLMVGGGLYAGAMAVGIAT